MPCKQSNDNFRSSQYMAVLDRYGKKLRPSMPASNISLNGSGNIGLAYLHNYCNYLVHINSNKLRFVAFWSIFYQTSHYCRIPGDIAHTSWIVPPLAPIFDVPGSEIFTTASNTLVGRGDLPFQSHPRLLVNGVIVIYFLDVMYITGNIYATTVYLRTFLPGIWFVRKRATFAWGLYIVLSSRMTHAAKFKQ